MKMTYAEQLRHPKWQERRLRILEAAGFECSNCGDKDTTLNVHHKRYVKGRMAWEYENEELEALCEKCHKIHHDLRARVDAVLAAADYEHSGIDEVLAGYLFGGYADDGAQRDFFDEHHASRYFFAGHVANCLIFDCGAETRLKIAELLKAEAHSTPWSDRVFDAEIADCQKDG